MLPSVESLRCALETYRQGSFAKAAKNLALSPSAVAHRVRQLEEQMQTSLFHREPNRLVPTLEAEAFIDKAQNALQALAACIPSDHSLRKAIYLGTRAELGNSWLSPSLPELRKELPDIELHLQIGAGPDLIEHLHQNKIQALITSTPKASLDGLHTIDLHRERYMLVGEAEFLHKNPIESLDDLRHHTLIDTNQHLPLYSYWRQAVTEPPTWKNHIYAGGIGGVRSLVMRAEGLAVLPIYFIKHELAQEKLLTVLPDTKPQSDWFRLVFKPGNFDQRDAEKIAHYLREKPLI